MAKPATATNNFDPEIVNPILAKFDGFDNDLMSERGSYMAKCRNIRETIEATFDEAKALGLPKKELSILLKIRRNEKKSTALYRDLEADQQITLAMIAATEKVADLPLWRSAAERKPIPGVDVDAPRHHKPMFNN